MGIEILEQGFIKYLEDNKDMVPILRNMAEKVLNIQQKMRSYLDEVTPFVCSKCENPCCLIMPVEGWFTKNDYYLYRMLYKNPVEFINGNKKKDGCVFLGTEGCVLPGNMRSFPCIKVNCKAIKKALENNGWKTDYNRLYNRLCVLQEKTWSLID